jgi:hypothetical protein
MTTTVDKMPIHDSLAELLAEISERGRDSYVAGLAKNRSIYLWIHAKRPMAEAGGKGRDRISRYVHS